MEILSHKHSQKPVLLRIFPFSFLQWSCSEHQGSGDRSAEEKSSCPAFVSYYTGIWGENREALF